MYFSSYWLYIFHNYRSGYDEKKVLIPENDDDFIAFVPQIVECFNEDNPKKCLDKLYSLNSTWGTRTAKQLENKLKNESECVDHWFALTRLSKELTIDEIREKELEIMADLGVK